MIDLAAFPITGFSDAAHAQRSPDRQHQRIDHDRRRAGSAEGNPRHVPPEHPGLGIEQVVTLRADRVQCARIHDDAAFGLRLAVERMALATHRNLAAGLVGINRDANDIVDRARPEDRGGRAADTGAEIYAGYVAGGFVEQHLAIEVRQIAEGLGFRVPSP